MTVPGPPHSAATAAATGTAATAPAPPAGSGSESGARSASALVRYGTAMFALGLIAIVVTFIGYAAGDDNRPLWQNLLCLLAPAGFGMALVGLVRAGRADARRVAALYPSAPRPPAERRPGPRTAGAALRWTAAAEATSWLLLIAATVVKYTAGWALGVQILGPVHGVLFLAYVAFAMTAWWSLRWSVWTLLIVLVDSLLPGGGFLVARRRDLRPSRQLLAVRTAI